MAGQDPAAKDRNVYASTTSILSSWGSGIVAEGLGFLLNNRMNYFWLTEHTNQVAPRKRTRQTINPCIATLNGKPYIVVGTPGADQQPQSMLQNFLNVVEFGINPQDAVEYPKFGETYFPASSGPHAAANQMRLENRIPADVAEALKAKGHNVTIIASVGGDNKIAVIDPVTNMIVAGCDPRGQGYAIGW